jgi:predicted porin
MTKKFLAHCVLLSLGLAAGAVHAQSSISISGMLDIGVYRDTNKDTKLGEIQRSNIAFSGTEDLGGGLAATFRLSHRFQLSNGAQESADKPFWHGESTVGLKGAFGSVQFGRRLDAIYNNDWAFDPWFNFDRVASPAWDLWHYNFPSDPTGNSGTAEYGRLNNGIFYDSPSFGGAALHLSGSVATQAAGSTNKPLAASITYDSAAVNAMLGHGKNSAGNTDNFIGLKGNLRALSVMGVYDVTKAGTSKAKSATLGVNYAFDQLTLRGGWGQVDLDGTKAEKMLGLGALYNLSKRTSTYVDFAHKTFPTTSANTYGIGLTHNF